MTTNVKPINKCEKCGCEILDGDRLCIHCYKKRVIITSIIFSTLWISTAIITAILFETAITFGIWWFWFILFPYVIKKSRYINKRKMYFSIPVTLGELAPKLKYNPELLTKYRKKYGLDEDSGFNSKYFALYVQNHIYKDLAHCKSNILAEYPEYLKFVRGVDHTLDHTENVNENNKYTSICQNSEKDNYPFNHSISSTDSSIICEVDKTSSEHLLHQSTEEKTDIKKLPNEKKNILIVPLVITGVLTVISIGISVFSFIEYSQTNSLYNGLSSKYDKLQIKYNNLDNECSDLRKSLATANTQAAYWSRKYSVDLMTDTEDEKALEEISQKYDELKSEYDLLKEENQKLKNAGSSYEQFSFCIVSSSILYKDLYHKRDCSLLSPLANIALLDADTAEEMGYSPCPYCVE